MVVLSCVVVRVPLNQKKAGFPVMVSLAGFAPSPRFLSSILVEKRSPDTLPVPLSPFPTNRTIAPYR